MKVNKIYYLIIQIISADVVLVDDLNLGRTPAGNASLARLSGSLQNQYGGKVNIVSPIKIQRRISPTPLNMNRNIQPQRIQAIPIRNNRIAPIRRPIQQPIKRDTFTRPRNLAPVNNIPGMQKPQNIGRSPAQMPIQEPSNMSNRSQPDNNPIYSPIYYPNSGISDSTLSDISNELKNETPRTDPNKNIPDIKTFNMGKKNIRPSAVKKPIAKSISRTPSTESTLPSIEKEIDESIFDTDSKPSITDDIEPPTKKTSILDDIELPIQKPTIKTITKTVKEPVRIIEPVSITITEKKEDPKKLTPQEDIEEAAKEVSRIVVPKMKGTGYLKKHNSDIISADKNRRTYIDYKLLESKEKQAGIEKKLRKLQELQDKLFDKLANIKDERENIKSKIDATINNAENSEATIKTLENEINKNAGELKLEEAEILKLEKELNDEKNKYMLLSDQQKVARIRLEKSVKKGGRKQGYADISRKKLGEYDKLVKRIEEEFARLKEKIDEVEKRRNSEIERQNKLEIEKKQIEDSTHLSFFALDD